ncbi:protein saal1 [Latimeria chalumnae]|uniref:Serum amyloid A like 1 n=1 Tax=Latimeria chalumnae TaxID=7897 RepID=H3AUK4_LATCH|nr:PREDICTED: protein SAAL1 [Latimeria chalumnae]|eukprot:XP_005990549.1 PREDICTED: protein SAAL1 [Latimeria chalumnae]
MDRNPSPPPSEEEEDAGGDAIGNTVYSKHWLFSTLTRLIEVVAPQKDESETGDGDVPTDLDEDVENEICKIWDMSMDHDVALFLQEFNAPEILLGVMAKSKCPRLTEICVGILGNMACFQETCLSISKNTDLGEVLLLLLGDSDPPTLLETSRLLSTCLSHSEVATTWVERVQKNQSVYDHICFIMSSSTNVELLVKVGEVVDKLFDLDEELMLNWIRVNSSQSPSCPTAANADQAPPSKLEIVPCLLEAARQLRSDNPEGLDIYMHILQLLTTVDEGIQTIVCSPKVGQETWNLLSEIVCDDLCQPDDPPIILQEQKTLLASILSVLSAMFASETQQEYVNIGKNRALVGSLTHILQHLEDCQKEPLEKPMRPSNEGTDEPRAPEEDFHLKILLGICCEFLSNTLSKMTKEMVSESIKEGFLSEKKCACAFRNLLLFSPNTVESFFAALHEADQSIAENLAKEFPSLRPNT